MSKEPGHQMPAKSNTQRPLPPEMTFKPSNRSFYGKVEPGQVVRIKKSTDDHLHECVATADGEWQLSGQGQARWYTTYEIWVRDPVSGAESDVIKFMYNGSCPHLQDVYVSRTTAFGLGQAGTEIVVYGPAGQVLGKTFIFGQDGPWSVKFGETLAAGEKFCITARLPNGNHTMPVFGKAETFSIDERNVGRVAGSGGVSGERILLLDAESENLLADMIVDERGEWAVTFDKLLADGTRIAMMRSCGEGGGAKAPPFTVTTANCLSPVINFITDACVGGKANPCLQVKCTQFRNHLPIATAIATADKAAAWRTDAFDLRPGDTIVATTATVDGTRSSQLYSSVIVGEERPGMPDVTSTREDGATGYANPGDHIVASCVERGVLAWGTVASDGRWALDWIPLPSWSDEEAMLVQFTVYTLLAGSGVNAPTSCFAMRYANDAYVVPPAPKITGYTDGSPNGKFTGTEGMDGTTITVYNSAYNSAVGPDSDPVVNNQWTVIATTKPGSHNQCFAVANGTSELGDLGATSPASDNFPVP